MRAIRLLGWSALAASASAVLVCFCPAAAQANGSVAHVHEGSVGNAILLTGLYDIECNALFLGDSESSNALGGSLTVIGSFTYARCTPGCFFSEENGPLEIQVSKAGREAVDVIAYFLSHLDCPGFVNCTYKKGPIRERRNGPASSAQPSGELSIQGETLLKESGALCLDTGRLDIVTTPFGSSSRVLVG